MSRGAPLHVLPWLVSRASGVVALVLITLSVLMGLAMAAGILRRPGLKRTVVRLHEHVALIALAAIAVHGVALIGDQWLDPGWRGITIPFAMAYRPLFTGLGIIAGYLAAIVGPSFYLRRRIGARRWRFVHRAAAAVWVLSVIHALGAGSDAARLWLRVLVVAPVVPLTYLFVLRVLRPRRAAKSVLRSRGHEVHPEHALEREPVGRAVRDVDEKPRAAPAGVLLRIDVERSAPDFA